MCADGAAGGRFGVEVDMGHVGAVGNLGQMSAFQKGPTAPTKISKFFNFKYIFKFYIYAFRQFIKG